MSASEWKKKKNSKIHQDNSIKTSYNINMNIGQRKILEPLHVEEKHLNKIHIAYIRHTGFYADSTSIMKTMEKPGLRCSETPCRKEDYSRMTDIVLNYILPIATTGKGILRLSIFMYQ
jgi:hypothetical protein